MVRAMLTTNVTESLPPEWQGAYSVERAHEWIAERDREGTTLLAVEKSSRAPAGLVILLETTRREVGEVDVRLGFVLAESAWGRGLATELIQGLVEWCRQAGVASIAGGVERDNIPSRRVLEKSGFVCDPATEGATVQQFELRFRRDQLT